MEIQSAFNSGVQGFQKATETADQAAANIVAQTSVARESAVVNEAPERPASVNYEQKIPDLNQSIVELKVAEHQAKASSEVIKTADESLGTLLDVTA